MEYTGLFQSSPDNPGVPFTATVGQRVGGELSMYVDEFLNPFSPPILRFDATEHFQSDVSIQIKRTGNIVDVGTSFKPLVGDIIPLICSAAAKTTDPTEIPQFEFRGLVSAKKPEVDPKTPVSTKKDPKPPPISSISLSKTKDAKKQKEKHTKKISAPSEKLCRNALSDKKDIDSDDEKVDATYVPKERKLESFEESVGDSVTKRKHIKKKPDDKSNQEHKVPQRVFHMFPGQYHIPANPFIAGPPTLTVYPEIPQQAIHPTVFIPKPQSYAAIVMAKDYNAKPRIAEVANPIGQIGSAELAPFNMVCVAGAGAEHPADSAAPLAPFDIACMDSLFAVDVFGNANTEGCLDLRDADQVKAYENQTLLSDNSTDAKSELDISSLDDLGRAQGADNET